MDHRADIFAAGVMLYEQLCGRRPFTGLNTDEVVTASPRGSPGRPPSSTPRCPRRWSGLPHRAGAGSGGPLPQPPGFIDAIEPWAARREVATPEQVAAYVEQLFPPERDPKRQALRRARLADPSNSGSHGPLLRQGLRLTQPAGAGRTRGRPAAPRRASAKSGDLARPSSPRAEAPIRSRPEAPGALKVAAALGVAVLLGGGAGCGLRPNLPAAG